MDTDEHRFKIRRAECGKRKPKLFTMKGMKNMERG
jgi:hypothetical protein